MNKRKKIMQLSSTHIGPVETLSTISKMETSLLVPILMKIKNKLPVTDWEIDAIINTVAPARKALKDCLTTFDWVALACSDDQDEEWQRYVHVDHRGVAYAGNRDKVHKSTVNGIEPGVYCPRTGYRIKHPTFSSKIDLFKDAFGRMHSRCAEKSLECNIDLKRQPSIRHRGNSFIRVPETNKAVKLWHFENATLKGKVETLKMQFDEKQNFLHGNHEHGEFMLSVYQNIDN